MSHAPIFDNGIKYRYLSIYIQNSVEICKKLVVSSGSGLLLGRLMQKDKKDKSLPALEKEFKVNLVRSQLKVYIHTHICVHMQTHT